MELFAWEHRRLWRRRSVRICALLCFAYCVIWGGVLNYQWLVYGSSAGTGGIYDNAADGYARIRDSQALAESYGGYLTDETLRRAVTDWRTLRPKPHLQSAGDWRYFQMYLTRLYPELREPELAYMVMIGYVDTAELTGFYARRQAYMDETLAAAQRDGLLTAADAAMLRAMDNRVAVPWRYAWAQGWDNLLSSSLASDAGALALFLALALGRTFSGEQQSGAAPLLLAAKYGRRRLARARIGSGLAFAAELFALVAAGEIGAQLLYLGPSGWDMPIQVVRLNAAAPWNMLQGELYELAYILLGAVGHAGVVMLLSALVKSDVAALALSLALPHVPGLLEDYLPAGARYALQLIPLAGSPDDFFRLKVLHVFGRGIWLPWLQLAVPVLLGLGCLPLAVRAWDRRGGR